MEDEYLRAVTPADIDLLYEWANDEDVRRFAFSSDYITYEKHKQWFSDMIKSEKVLQYIYFVNQVPVGQVRLNIVEDIAYVDYSINKPMRGQGYSKKMLLLMENVVRSEITSIKKIIAQVKLENTASRGLVEGLGYQVKCIEYTKEI